MRWLIYFYDFKFKWTAIAGIGIHPTKTWLSQLLNFKNAIWTWGHFRNTICKIEWHKRFKEGSEYVRDDERCGRSKEVNRSELIGQRVRVTVTMLRFLREFSKRFRRKRSALFKSGQWHFHQDNTPVHNSILVTDYLTKIGIKTVRHPLYSPDFAPCGFWLFPKLRGCRYETMKMKEAVTKVIDTIGLPWGLAEVFRTAQKVHYSRRRLLRKGLEFHVCTINKSAYKNKVWKLI